MKTLVKIGILAVAVTLIGTSGARAQDIPTPCTWDWEPKNDSWQHGTEGLWLKYSVQTILKLLPCQIGAFAEGSVDGVAGSSIRGEGVLTGVATKEVPVPWAATWRVSGKHSRGSVFGEWHLQDTSSSANIQSLDPPPDEPPSDGEGGEEEGEPEETTGVPGCPASPLLIDIAGNGFKLTTVDQGVLFDIDGDGQVEQIGWTKPDSDDVWLAMDRNGNGMIDSGAELFGNNTPVRPGQTAGNGFDALNFLHSESGVEAALDKAMAANDGAWGRLLLWRDANHNGISEPEELTRVVDSALGRVELLYQEISRVRKGNEIRQKSTVQWGASTRQIVDVWLAVR